MSSKDKRLKDQAKWQRKYRENMKRRGFREIRVYVHEEDAERLRLIARRMVAAREEADKKAR